MLPKQGGRERIGDAIDIRLTRIETQRHRVHRLLAPTDFYFVAKGLAQSDWPVQQERSCAIDLKRVAGGVPLPLDRFIQDILCIALTLHLSRQARAPRSVDGNAIVNRRYEVILRGYPVTYAETEQSEVPVPPLVHGSSSQVGLLVIFQA